MTYPETPQKASMSELLPTQKRVMDVVRETPPGTKSIIGFGGSKGGSKTHCAVRLAISLCISYPGNKGMVGRQEFNKLLSTTLYEFDKVCPSSILYKKHDQAPVYRDIRLPHWPKGIVSRIYFRGVEDWQAFGSEEYGFVILDEASEISPESAIYMLTILRHRLPPAVEEARVAIGQSASIPYIFYAGYNPFPGWAVNWFNRKQLDDILLNTPAGESVKVHYIPSRISDNTYLPTGYEEQTRAALEAAGKHEWVRRLIDGEWDVYEGQIYEHFSPSVHKWLGPVPTKDNYKQVIGGLDFGMESSTAHHTAGIVGVITHSGRLIRVDEFYDRGPGVIERQAKWMIEMQQKWADPIRKRVQWVADRSQIVGISEWRKNFSIEASRGGRDSVDAGIQAVAARLEKDGSGLPGSFYLPHLKNWEREMELYHRDPETQKVIKKDDHALDADRYMHEKLDRVWGDPTKLFKNVLATVKQG